MDEDRLLKGLSPVEKRMLLAQLLQERAQQDRVFPLSHGQRGLWGLSQMDAANAACNIHLPTRIRSQVNVPALRQSLQSLVDRHPSLRTTFESRDGQLVQQIHEEVTVSFNVVDASLWSEKELRDRLDEEVHRAFDIKQGPLLRTHLFSRAEDDHIFLATAHHIIMDYWSVIVLLKQIRDLYAANRDGREPPPAQESSTYGDFVRWQNELLTGPEGARLQTFWQQQLDGVPHTLDLPTDWPRPPLFTYRAGSVPCSISPDLTRQLTSLAAEHKVTLYTVLLSGLQVLLGHHSGEDDFIIGSPFSGRTRPGFEETVSCFVNMLPVRAKLAGAPTFREVLVRVRDTVIDALEHQDYPFSLMVEQLNVKRDLSRAPLVQVSLTLERSQWQGEEGRGRFLFPDADAQRDVAGLLGETYYIEQRACQLDQEWVLERSGDSIHGVVRYCADLFNEETMLRLVQRYQQLLASAAANSDRRISDLEWFSGSERRTVVTEWNQTHVDFPDDVCLHQLFERQARNTPQAVAVRFGERLIRYADLDDWANRLAHRLSGLGAGPGSLVALCFDRSPEMVAALLATLKAGAAYVPLDPASPAERLRRMLEETRPCLVLTRGDLQSQLPDGDFEVVSLDSLDDQPADFAQPTEPPTSRVQPDDLAYVVHTSGSTGKPKGVMVEHRSISNTVNWRREEFPLRPGDRVLSIVPYVFDASICIIFQTLSSGAELVLPEPGEELNPTRLVERIASERLTVLPIPPRLLDVIVNHPQIKECQDVRLVFTGGEAMPTDLASRVNEMLGVPLHNLYGPTETAVEATFWTCQPDDVRASHRIGRPIANAVTYVLDSNMQPLPIGVPGELYIGGVGVARGYLNEPELTAERFLGDPFSSDSAARMYRTGDCCRWLSDGSLEFLGRLDDQVKLRGHRIELGEIEHALTQLADVREAAVAIRSDSAGEPQLVAYLVPEDQDNPPDQQALHLDLKSKLPAYLVPTFFECLPNLPRTPNGKLDRGALPAPRFERTLVRSPYVAPRTPLEEFLTQSWGELLDLDRVGVEDGFYELGGSSIQGAMLVSRLQEKLGHRIRLTTLFEMSNIATLARHLVESQPEVIAERFGEESLRQAKADSNVGEDGLGTRSEVAQEATAVRTQLPDVLVALQPEGDRPPLFMVHPPGGIVTCYLPLAHQLGHEQPLYGIRARGLHEEEEFPDRLQDMAAEYAAAIRTVQTVGPYFLGGWSLGGVVAYEIAQQFVAQGERIGLLALLDTAIPFSESNAEYSGEIETSGREYGLDITLEELADLGPDEQLPFLWDHVQKLGVIDEDAPADVIQQFLEDLKRVFHAHVRLATEYELRPYPGRITLFRPQDAPVEIATARDRGWEQLADSVDVHFVPGQHHTMIKPPHIQVLAARLRDCIQTAIDSAAAT